MKIILMMLLPVFAAACISMQPTPSVTSVIQLLGDKTGLGYLGLEIPAAAVQPYLAKLKTTVSPEAFAQLTQNRDRRDGLAYHVTLITPPEFSHEHAFNKAAGDSTFQNLVGRTAKIELVGLGKVVKDGKEVFFIVCESAALQAVRQEVGLSKKDFHITLGFNPSDLYDVAKDRTTLVP
jgi:hypothetical protein